MSVRVPYLGVLAACAALLGAAPPEPISETPPPIPTSAALASYLVRGNAQIRGKLIVPTRLFGKVTFGNVRVYLVPYSDYTYWYVMISGRDVERALTASRHYAPSLRQYTRHSDAALDGSFQFDNLPVGHWIVDASVTKSDLSSPTVRRTALGTNIDGEQVMVPVAVPGIKLKEETDFVAATAETVNGRADVIDEFGITGAHLCCEASIDR
jgi:hypothetical protein